MKVLVTGDRGYIGAVLVPLFREAGHEVVGLDADIRKVQSLERSSSYVEDVPDSALEAVSGRLRPTNRYSDLGSCNAVIL